MSQGFAREARIGVDLHVGETLYYTANDTFAKADYPGLYGVRVQVQGAGGGGGGAEATSGSEHAEAGGGGGGGFTVKIIQAADLSSSEAITVGSGGSGGAAGHNNGVDGGSSSFGSHCSATGGVRGQGGLATSATISEPGGLGGTGSDGDLNITGGSGSYGRVIGGSSAVLTSGGDSWFSARAFTTDGSSFSLDGTDGLGPGGGGGGARNGVSQSARPGGDGADGIIIVEVLYERKIAVDEDIHTQYLNDTRHNAAHGALRAERITSNQTITSTETLIYNSIVDEDDPDGDISFNTSTGVATINNAGWYLVNAGAFMATPSTDTLFNMRLLVNGSDNPASKRFQSGLNGAARVDTFSTTLKLAATDTVEIQMGHNDSSSVDFLVTSSSFMTIVKVREA